MRDDTVVLITKTDPWSGYAQDVARVIFGERLSVHSGNRDEPFPEDLKHAHPAVLLSFLSPWIIPAEMLSRAGLALNFHPGSAAYPGIGCYNFALYEGASEYGAVCHRMAPRVDTGEIILERLFPISPRETVATLKLRTMVVMLEMFHAITSLIERGVSLPSGQRQWTRRPFRRSELDALGRIDARMAPDEIRRRVHATEFPGQPGAFVEIAGVKFMASPR